MNDKKLRSLNNSVEVVSENNSKVFPFIGHGNDLIEKTRKEQNSIIKQEMNNFFEYKKHKQNFLNELTSSASKS
jgi:hypothetical protein